jgi:hypothetical protein
MSPKVQINGKSKIYISALDKTSLIDSPVKAAGTLQYLFSRSPNDVSFHSTTPCTSLHDAFSLKFADSDADKQVGQLAAALFG